MIEKGVASTVVEGLRSQPLALALVIVNVLFLAFGYYLMGKVAEGQVRRDALITQLVKDCTAK